MPARVRGEFPVVPALEPALNARTATPAATTTTDPRRTARDAIGWDGLRPGQLEAMEHVMAGRDTLVVMPTGSGKSAICQVPALEAS